MSKQTQLRIVARARQRKLAESVVRVLNESEVGGLTCKELARLLKQPLRSVQRTVQRLVEERVIRAETFGRYSPIPGTFDVTADLTAQAGWHGLVLRHDSWRARVGSISGTALAWSFPAADSGRKFGLATRIWRERLVTFQYYPGTDRLLVSCSTTRRPVPWEEGGEFRAWLEGLVDPISVSGFKVVAIGLNVDNEQVTLKGVRSVELSEFGNWTQRMYQKVSALRHEIHLYKPRHKGQELSLADAMTILLEGSPLRQMREVALLQLKAILKQEELTRAAPPATAEPPKPNPLPPKEALSAGYG